MGSDIKVCKRCKRMYRYAGENICDTCTVELDNVFLKVRDFLDAHFSASVKDIIKDTEVEERDVLQLLREGRFKLNVPDGTLTCEKCGKPITTGSICDGCRDKLSKTLKDFTDGLKPKIDDSAKLNATKRSKGMHIER